MTTVLDQRGAKAVALATDAGQWIRCKTSDGRKLFGIRSSRNADHVYFVTRSSCTCKGFEYSRDHDCKHQIAVRLHCALLAEQEAPKVEYANLSRILGQRLSHGVIPAAQIERES